MSATLPDCADPHSHQNPVQFLSEEVCLGGLRETHEEAGEGHGVLDLGGSSRGGGEWSGCGEILQLKPTGFPDGCNM
jgi:hypothetical protein